MEQVKIEHDVPGCIGCGACASVCPDTWEMVENSGEMKSRAKVTKISGAAIAVNKEAAEICPVNVIHLIDVATGKKLI